MQAFANTTSIRERLTQSCVQLEIILLSALHKAAPFTDICSDCFWPCGSALTSEALLFPAAFMTVEGNHEVRKSLLLKQ